MPLLLPLKPAVSYDLGKTLAKWLDSDLYISFQPMNPLQFILPKPEFHSTDCWEDILRLQSLRNHITSTFLKPSSHKLALNESVLEECYEYHAVLLEFEKQGFPAVDDDTTPIKITWKSAFVPGEQEEHSSLVWERSVIMFNIAALLTSKIVDSDITDRTSCKDAIGYCQQAATILGLLRQLVASQDYVSVDVSNGLLLFWEKLLLAEAQQFVYRMMNNTDSTKHATLSLLSQSAHILFNDALTAAREPRLLSQLADTAKDWATYCKAVSMLLASRAEFHAAVGHRMAYEHGNEIARLRDCQTKLQKLQKFIQSLDRGDSIIAYEKLELKTLLPIVSDRLKEADRDNYKIYQEIIPKTLPELPSKQLAKVSTSLPEPMVFCKYRLFQNVTTTL